MRPQTRAALWLAATLLVGVMLGMLLNGALFKRDGQGPRPNAGPQGFIAEMERVIQPRDDAQRAQLRPFLLVTDSLNRLIVDDARQSMRASMDSMRKAIAPLLDSAQRQRLAEMGMPNNRGRSDEPGSAPGLEFGGRGGPPNGPPPDERRSGSPSRGGPPR